MEIFDTSTPEGTSSSSKMILCGKPALFLNTIFSPGATENSLGTNARDPSLPPSKTSMARALLASIALAAVAATATPTSWREAFTATIGAGEAVAAGLAVHVLAHEATLRPVNEGMVMAAEVVMVAIFLVSKPKREICGCLKEMKR